MYVRSIFKKELIYKAHGKKYVIKPGMNKLDGVTKEELVKVYGNTQLIFLENAEEEKEVAEAPTETPVEDNGAKSGSVISDELKADNGNAEEKGETDLQPAEAPANNEGVKASEADSAVKAPKVPAKATKASAKNKKADK